MYKDLSIIFALKCCLYTKSPGDTILQLIQIVNDIQFNVSETSLNNCSCL